MGFRVADSAASCGREGCEGVVWSGDFDCMLIVAKKYQTVEAVRSHRGLGRGDTVLCQTGWRRDWWIIVEMMQTIIVSLHSSQ